MSNPTVRDRLTRLGASQLGIVVAGLLTVLCVTYLTEGPSLEDFYARAFALPRMEERWGFHFGAIRVERDGGHYYGIVSLTPDGRLAQLGLRLHDAPFSPEGPAYFEFYEAWSLSSVANGRRSKS